MSVVLLKIQFFVKQNTLEFFFMLNNNKSIKQLNSKTNTKLLKYIVYIVTII